MDQFRRPFLRWSEWNMTIAFITIIVTSPATRILVSIYFSQEGNAPLERESPSETVTPRSHFDDIHRFNEIPFERGSRIVRIHKLKRFTTNKDAGIEASRPAALANLAVPQTANILLLQNATLAKPPFAGPAAHRSYCCNAVL